MPKKPIIFSIVLALITAPALLAQGTTGSISGTVMDETGGVIPGVTVTVTNLDTGISRVLVSGDEGLYLAPQLDVGNYEVKGELTGFQTSVRTGILLTVERSAVVDLTMQVGAITEVVTVTGEAALVDTTKSDMSGLITTQQIADLPVNGRNVLRLALLEGGVLERIGQTATSNSLIGGFGTQMTIAGARAHQNAFLLDGARVNNYNNYGPGSLARVQLGTDSVREFKVLTSNYSAEHGNAAGGVVSWVTKSGSNDYHGSLAYYRRDDALDAANYITNSRGQDKDPFYRHQFGGSIGGPIVQDRTFFFFNFEGIREELGLIGIANVPTAEAWQGILPAGPGSCPTGFPLDDATGNCVGTVNPDTLRYMHLFPPANGREHGDGRAEHVLDASEPTNEDYYVGKVDHNFNENHSFYVRFVHDAADKTSGFNTVTQSLLETANNYWTVELKSILTPSFLQTVRYSFVRNLVQDEEDLQVDIDPSLYFLPHTGKLGSMWIGPGSSGGLGSYLVWPGPSDGRPRNEIQNLFQFNYNATWTQGRHSIKFGLENRRVQNNLVFVVRWGGRYRFNDLARFLLGNAREVTGTTPASDFQRGWRHWLWGFYVQDDFRVLPNLTLNLGLRYSPHDVPQEHQGKVSNLNDPLNDTTFTLGNPIFDNPSLANWAPRIGLAWDPFGDGKTSVRTGAGIFYHLLDIGQSFLQGTISQPPVDRFLLNTRNSPGGVPFPLIPIDQGFPAGSVSAFPKPFDNIDTPKMLKWNLDVQRELTPGTIVSVGYVGSKGQYLWADRHLNVCATENFEGRRFFRASCNPARNPNFATIQVRNNPSSSSYHAMIIKVNRRFNGAFGLQSSFTWSRSIDDESGLRGSTGRGSQLIWGGTYDDINAIHGRSDFDVKRNLVLNASWALPSPEGGFAKAALGGWQVNGILTLSDGWPFSGNMSANWFPDGAPFGGYMADLVEGRGHNAINKGNPDAYIDTSAFQLPASSDPADQALGSAPLNAPGCGAGAARCRAMGNLGRNTLIAPGVATFDFSLFKRWGVPSVGEQANVEFRAEFFNLFNRANFMRPISTQIFGSRGTPVRGTGTITQTTTTARQIQLGVRFTF